MTQARHPEDSLSTMLEAIETDLQAAASILNRSAYYESFYQRIAYHFGWEEASGTASGKRVRPLLCLLCCQASGGEWRQALPAASGLELIHNFSLIHDDIEDNSATRRGRPTLWKAWNLPQALNAGDALLVLSHFTAQRLFSAGVPSDLALEIQRTIDEGCLRVTLGQHLDLEFETRSVVSEQDYLEMIEGKTASLISSACASGAMIGGASPAAADHFREFGRHMGMAFQVQDDILGIWGTPAVTGKPAGDDLLSHKKSLPVLFGLANCKEFSTLWSVANPSEDEIGAMTTVLEGCGALEHAQKAAREHTYLALENLANAKPASPAADQLRDLADRLLTRRS
jgi:geranylgeranyl diphosphate synthase type I